MMAHSSFGVVSMLAELHHHSLCTLTNALHMNCEGLSAAARIAYRRELIALPMRKRLERLDYAYAVVRHLTPLNVESFPKDLSSSVSGCADSFDISSDHGIEDEYAASWDIVEEAVEQFAPLEQASDSSSGVTPGNFGSELERLAKTFCGMAARHSAFTAFGARLPCARPSSSSGPPALSEGGRAEVLP
eukprot:UN0652